MAEHSIYRYWLPAPAWNPKGKPRLSSFHMTEAEAKERGAIRRDDASRMVVRDSYGGGQGLGIALAGGGAKRGNADE